MLLFLLKDMPTGPTIVTTSFDEQDPMATFAAAIAERGRGHYTITAYEPMFAFDVDDVLSAEHVALLREAIQHLAAGGRWSSPPSA